MEHSGTNGASVRGMSREEALIYHHSEVWQNLNSRAQGSKPGYMAGSYSFLKWNVCFFNEALCFSLSLVFKRLCDADG